MKISLRKYLLYSSVFAIFTEAFFFHLVIDWKLLYLIIVVNYAVLLSITTLKVNRVFLFVIAGLMVHGIVVNAIIGVPPNFMLSQIAGICVVSLYYYNFIRIFDRLEIIAVYLKFCLYAAVIGYIFYALDINLNDGRLQSIFKEPAHYVVVVLPACYVFLREKRYLPFLIIFGTLILSNSSLGYIGCALMFIVPNVSWRRMLHLFWLIPLVIGAMVYTYQNFPFFKLRIQETYESINAINTGKYDEYTNLSSYALLSNLHIAKKNVTDHPLGSGIGSHVYMHSEVYLKTTRPPDYLKRQNKQDINAHDANSLFTRMISELGILGFFLIVVLLSKALAVFRSPALYLAQGIFIYLLLKLFREGHYFPPEFYFFIWMLYFTYRDYRNGLLPEPYIERS